MDNKRLMLNFQLFDAIGSSNQNEVEDLLSKGADINFGNLYHKAETPLHMAVAIGNPKMVKFLLYKGANPDAKNSDNQKPIELCAGLKDKEKQEIDNIFREHYEKNQYGKFNQNSEITQSTRYMNTYTKRQGTSSMGQYYETKILTMVLFRLLHDDRIENFYLGNDLDAAGCFNDIVFRTNEGGKPHVYCLQVKYMHSERSLNFEDMITRNLFESYLKIRHSFNSQNKHAIFEGDYRNIDLALIIFTPAKLVYSENVVCENNNGCKIFNSNSAGKISRIKCTNHIYEKFIVKSQEWHKKTIAIILANLMLTLEYDTSNLKEALSRLKNDDNWRKCLNIRNEEDDFNYENILQLYSITKVMKNSSRSIKRMCKNIDEILHESMLPTHDVHSEIVKDFFDRLTFCTEQANENEIERIIIHEMKDNNYKSDDNIFLKAFTSIEKWKNRIDHVSYLTKNDNIFNQVSNELQFEKLHFIGTNKISSDVLNFRMELINSKLCFRIKMLQDKNIKIFFNVFSSTPFLSCIKLIQLSNLYGIDFRFIVIDSKDVYRITEVFFATHPQCLLIAYLVKVDKQDIEEMHNKVKRLIIVTEHKYDHNSSSIEDESNNLMDLKPHCQEMLLDNMVNFQGSPISLKNLLNSAPRALIDAATVQKLIIGENIVIPKTVVLYGDEHFTSCYIKRDLLDGNLTKTIESVKDKFVIVAAEPGMGKSLVLTELAGKLKIENPSFWIVRINLIDCTEQFQWLTTRHTLKEDDAMIFLIKTMSWENDSFERKLFQYFCEQSKIILLIDGFDEICPDYTNIVLQLLQIYKNYFVSELWVTTRTGEFQKVLDQSTMAKTYSLRPFTLDEAKLFLYLFLKTKSKVEHSEQKHIESYINKLLSYLAECIEYNVIELVGVPLQIKMIAEIFLNNFEKYSTTNGNYFRFDKIDLITMYEHFIQMKFDVLMGEKNKIDTSRVQLKKMVEKSCEEMLQKYKRAAICTLFDRNDMQTFMNDEDLVTIKRCLNEVKRSEEKTGMITDVIDGKPKFVHQTYAEFFAAHYLWDKMSALPIEKFDMFVLNIVIKNLMRNERTQIAKFLFEIVKKTYITCTDWDIKIQIMLKIIMNGWDWIVGFNNRAFIFVLGIIDRLSIFNKNYTISLKILLNDKFHEIKNKELLLLLSCKVGYIGLVRLLTEENSGIVNVTYNWLDNWTPLHFAANYGHTNIVQHLLRNAANTNYVTKQTGKTPLHMAAKKGHCDIVQMLLVHNADVNVRTKQFEFTPLHLAAREGFFDVITVLIDHNAEINSKTSTGKNALYLAILKGHLKIVQLLIKHGVDISKDLHYLQVAVKHGHSTVVEFLLKSGVNPDGIIPECESADEHMQAELDLDNPVQSPNQKLGKYPYTSLTDIYRPDNQKSVECNIKLPSTGLLKPTSFPVSIELEIAQESHLDCEENSNEVEVTEGSPLHIAALHNFSEIAMMLIKAGANVNIKNKNGETPLHVAASTGNSEIIKILLANGANAEIVNIDKQRPDELCAHFNGLHFKYILPQFSENSESERLNSLKRKHSESDFTHESYTKRKGSVNHFYETKLLTMVLFRLLHDEGIENFYLGTNLDEAACFDDIAFRIISNAESHVYCVQAKHQKIDHVMKITDEDSFSLKMYFQSFLKIRYMFNPQNNNVLFQSDYEKTKLKLIIFTPAVFAQTDELYYETTNWSKIIQTKTPGKMAKIKCTETVMNFLKGQSIEWHRKTVAKILAKLILICKIDTVDLKQALEQVQTSNLLSKFTNNNEKVNYLSILKLYSNQQIMPFNVPVEQRKLFEKIEKNMVELHLPSEENHRTVIEDFCDTLQFYSGQATENELDEIIKLDMKNNKYIDADALYAKSYNAVEKWLRKSGQVLYQTKNCEIFKNAVNEIFLENCHKSSLNHIMTQNIIFRREVIQRNPQWCNLLKILQNDRFCVNIYSFTPLLTRVKIIQFFQWNEIDFQIVDLDDNIHVLQNVSENSFQNFQNVIVVLYSGTDSDAIDKVTKVVKKLILITVQNYSGDCTSIADDMTNLLDLKLEVQEKLLEKMVTFQGYQISLKMLLDKAPKQFIDSTMLEMLVSNEDLIISNENFSLNSVEHYIHRDLFDSQHKPYPVKSITDISDRAVTLAAEPGMGKSSFLAKLARETKNNKPTSWIIRINLLDFSKQFNDWSENKTVLNVNIAKELLIKTTRCKENSKIKSFENTLAGWYCDKFKIILLIDGFDEINPRYDDIVLQLLKIFKHNFTSKIWITTRPERKQRALEELFEMRAYTLKPFTEDDVNLYFKQIWNTIPGLDQKYVNDLKSKEFVRIPLHLKMIAMLLQEHEKIHFDENYLVTIYENFVNVNMRNFAEKTNLDQLKLAAMKTLFNKEDLERVLDKNEMCTDIEDVIIQREPIFDHPIFSEFLAALYAWEKFVALKNIELVHFISEFFIECIIKKERNQIALFLKKYAKKRIEENSNYANNGVILLDRLAGISPEFSKNKSFALILGIVEWSIISKPNLFEKHIINENAVSKLLTTASESGFIELAKLLINTNSSAINITFDWLKGWTALHFAARNGFENIVTLLLKNQANVNKNTDDTGITPLHLASEKGNSGIVELLLNQNANVNSRMNRIDNTPLHMAVQKGYIEIVSLLLSKGADINSTTYEGETPLHIASRNSHVEIVEELIKNRANVNSKTRNGSTPLHYAAKTGRTDIVEILIRAGSDVNAGTSDYVNSAFVYNRLTPVHIAASYGHAEVLEKLIEYKANIFIKTIEGLTPLHLAVQNNCSNTANILIRSGANPNRIKIDLMNKSLQLSDEKKHKEMLDFLRNIETMHIN